jgi:hypothetical protein
LRASTSSLPESSGFVSPPVKRYGPLLLMLGLLLGPTYYIFCEYLSGEDSDTFVLTERAARWTLPDGTILHVSNGKAFRPVTLKLDPEMNRIAFRLTFEAAPAPSDTPKSTDEYQITLLQSDQPIFERALVVRLAPGGKTSVETDRFAVYYPGAYELLLQETGAPRVPVSQVTLVVKKNIDTLLLPLMWGGLAMLVVGLAITLEPYLPRGRLR